MHYVWIVDICYWVWMEVSGERWRAVIRLQRDKDALCNFGEKQFIVEPQSQIVIWDTLGCEFEWPTQSVGIFPELHKASII